MSFETILLPTFGEKKKKTTQGKLNVFSMGMPNQQVIVWSSGLSKVVDIQSSREQAPSSLRSYNCDENQTPV